MNLEDELLICQKHKGQGYCYRGVCKYCGAKQLLRKLMTGETEHDEGKHRKFKRVAGDGK